MTEVILILLGMLLAFGIVSANNAIRNRRTTVPDKVIDERLRRYAGGR